MGSPTVVALDDAESVGFEMFLRVGRLACREHPRSLPPFYTVPLATNSRAFLWITGCYG